MNSRREFVRELVITGACLAAPGTPSSRDGAEAPPSNSDGRESWLNMLQRIAGPVIENLADNRLRERMPVECATGQLESRRKVTHLEALGRTLAGVAPWLELGGGTGAEAESRQRWAARARQGLVNAITPGSADYLHFTAGAQCLVDAAFLAHALLRAPRELWGKLDAATQNRLLDAMKSTRSIKPGNNNWLLFSAMVETFLAAAGTEWQVEPIERAVASHEEWYRGDGAYGDGPEFHWDYYNSFVIQPFLIDLLERMAQHTDRWLERTPSIVRRARRYAAIQERLIAPDGTFPVIGRSIAYRCGAFQLLAQIALRKELPDALPPAQVRSALGAVIQRTLGAPEIFDEHGWLRIGLAGRQPGLGESYISTGSLYLCTVAFLPLGLPADDPFWTGPAIDWTSRKVWSGQDMPADHALPSV